LDRVVAASALALTAGALLVITAITHVAPPPLALNDPRAATRLYELMQRGEHATYIVDYAFSRADGGFRSTETDARTRGVHLSRSGTTLLIQRNGVAYDCELAGEQSGCRRLGPVARSLPDSEVLRVANLVGAYNVIRTGDRTIAGEQAECFRITATGASHVLEAIGNEEDACYAADGIPLRTRTSGATIHPTERVAQRVLRTWDENAITRLLAGFEAPPLGN
jgi:hypothetical protein